MTSQDVPPAWDVIIVGSGPGGGSVAHALASTGKRILILERGGYLPRSSANWSSETVFVDGSYQVDETWFDQDGKPFAPALHRYVGGNSKVYGAALFRLRERDFEAVQHRTGVSPAWPVGYADFAPWYDAAEKLFAVHGQRGEDPLEPPAGAGYPHPPVTHGEEVAKLADDLRGIGLKPFHLPLGIRLEEDEHGNATPQSPCIKCEFFDGYPCPMNAKADAQVMCVDPTIAAWPNVTLLTHACVERLSTGPDGRTVTGVHVTREDGREEVFTAPVVVVAAGALSSALLLLRSKSEAHPEGLANGSGLVGRNYMRHDMKIVMALLRQPNDSVFQKTLAWSDWYWGDEEDPYPIGLVQMCATSHTEQIKGEALPKWLEWLPGLPFEEMARHSMSFWLQAEDLAHPDNRVYYKDGEVHLDLVREDREPLKKLQKKLETALTDSGYRHILLERSLYLGKNIAVGGTAHQAGTCVFGTDPATSVLDVNCRAHEVDNLYVTDASFFPSIGAVNPTLTIIANALRVADHIKSRLA
ncbi:MAG: GMC family oxidoreductase [Caulobacteraceae bacterium]|nr:GMC family oxidoreductase [Caulobacter sp.]